MANIAVVGPGAIGGTLAVRLVQTGRHSVTVCARSALAQLTLETAEGTSTVAPTILTSPHEGEPVDWVCVATKAYDSAGAAVWLDALVGPATRVAVVQNGVEHAARFAPYLSQSRILPVIADIPVERAGPGRFKQRLSGRLIVGDSLAGRAFADLFAGAPLQVELTSDFQTEAWRKLALNCAGAVCALVLKPAALAWNEGAADIMRGLVRECIAVGQMEGAVLHDSVIEDVIERYRKEPPDAVNSLLADRIAGRPTEIDARNGAVVRFGRKHGIATPMNQLVATLLELAAS